MSNFSKLTKHPLTGKWEMADWLDNYFGQHHYGVKFPGGEVFNANEKDLETKDSKPIEAKAAKLVQCPRCLQWMAKKKYIVHTDTPSITTWVES